MANRDFEKIKRTIQDFSLGAGNGEGTSGEPKEVETLPEVGEANVIYKTPDGKYWIYEDSAWTELTASSDVDACAVGNIQNKYFDPDAFLELLTAKGVNINETTYADDSSFKLGLILEFDTNSWRYYVNTDFISFAQGCENSALHIEDSTVTPETIETNSSFKEMFENEDVVEYFNNTALSTDINYYWMIQWRVGQTNTINFSYVTPKELETIFYTK